MMTIRSANIHHHDDDMMVMMIMIMMMIIMIMMMSMIKMMLTMMMMLMNGVSNPFFLSDAISFRVENHKNQNVPGQFKITT